MSNAKPIHIDLTTGLKKIRRAFNKDELAMQNRIGSQPVCFYAGPCAIGVLVPKRSRKSLDDTDDTQISSLIQNGFVNAPADQVRDLKRLQAAHDQGTLKQFDEVLTELENKYGAAA